MVNRKPSKIFQNGRRPLLRSAHPADLAERVEHAHGLDGAIQTITRAVRQVLRPGRVKDALHGVPLGHPAHPPLTDVPMGCWISAALLDLLPGTERASRILVAAGLAGAVPTALTGITDWSALHREQKRVGLVHALSTTSASTLYAASLVARHRGHGFGGRTLSLAGLTALFAGSYLGGHMSYRQAVGASHADSLTHLVPLGWHDLCPVEDLPEGSPVHRMLGYISLFVMRDEDEVYVLADRCRHLAGPLHQGRIVEADGDLCVLCPWHGSTFRVHDGTVVHGPATGRQPSFETRVLDNGTLQVRPIP